MTDIVKEIKDICQKLILCKSNIKEGLEHVRELEPYFEKIIPNFAPNQYVPISQSVPIQERMSQYNQRKFEIYKNMLNYAQNMLGAELENEVKLALQGMCQCYNWILDIMDLSSRISPKKDRPKVAPRFATKHIDIPPSPIKPAHAPTLSFTSSDQISIPPSSVKPSHPTFSFTSGGEFSVPPAPRPKLSLNIFPEPMEERPPPQTEPPKTEPPPTPHAPEKKPTEELPPPEEDPTIPIVKMYIEQVREDKDLIPTNEPKKLIMYILNTLCVETLNREQTVEVFVKLGNELSAAYHKFLITQHNGEESDDPFFGEVNLVPDLNYSLDLDEIWALLDDFLYNKNWESIKTIINHYISFFVQRFLTIPQETIEARRTAAQTWINQVIEDGNAMTENNARTLAKYITTQCKEFAASIDLDEFLKLGKSIAPAYHKYLLLKHKGEEFDHPFDYLIDLDPLYYNDNQLSAADLIHNFLDKRDFNYLHTLIRDYFESCIDDMCGRAELPPLVGVEEEEEDSEEEASSEDEPREMEQEEEIEPLWLDDYTPQHERDAEEEEEKAEPPKEEPPEEHVYTKEEILNKIDEFYDPFHPERIKQSMLKDLKIGPYGPPPQHGEKSDDEKKT